MSVYGYGRREGLFAEKEQAAVLEAMGAPRRERQEVGAKRERIQFEYQRQQERDQFFQNLQLAPIQGALVGPAAVFGNVVKGAYGVYVIADTGVQAHRAITSGTPSDVVGVALPLVAGMFFHELIGGGEPTPQTSGSGPRSSIPSGYKIQTCNDSTMINGPTSFSKIGIQTREAGGALTDPVTKTIWIHEDLITANGLVRKWGARLNVNQVTAHELGHAQNEGGRCAMASRTGADLPGLTVEERMGLLEDAVHIAPEEGISVDDLHLPPDYRPPTPAPKAP